MCLDGETLSAEIHRVLPQGLSPRVRSPGRESSHRTYKRGLNSKLHLAVDSHGMPVRVSLSEGTVAHCTQAHSLIADIAAEYLLAD